MINEPARSVRYVGQVEHRHEADAITSAPGDVALVVRGRPRSVVICCPDGCGERLTINVDERAGPAWDVFNGPKGFSLFPSVWRDSGCKSHFIVWRDVLIWCDRFEHGNREPRIADAGLEERVLMRLSSQLQSYRTIALELGEVPWDVSRACRSLVRRGMAAPGPPTMKEHYRRADRSVGSGRLV